LNGSGEVTKLSLPLMQDAGRVRLPNVQFFGQLLAENITVSPTDPNVVAVSMWRINTSPRHAGVALLRNLVLQPLMTQEHTGSNLVAFDGSGQVVFGYNNETTEFGLRRIAVQPDGLVQGLVVPANNNFGTRVLEATPAGVMLDRTLYRGSDLVQIGQVNAPGGGCRHLRAVNRFAGFQVINPSSGEQRLVVADAATFVTLATPMYSSFLPPAFPTRIVPGPAGQVALQLGNFQFSSPASELWLFTSAALQ
jgi:hypothetical protein